MIDRATRAAALFGLPMHHQHDPVRWSALRMACAAARALHADAAPGRILMLAGPSGGGKSTALALLGRRLARQRRAVVRPPAHLPRRRPAIDAVGDSFERALGVLAAAGLAEAALLARPAGALSDGQRARLRIAAGMDRCTPGAALLIDEFAAELDRATACSLACALARWARREVITLVVATTRDDLLESLGPDVLAILPLPGETSEPPAILRRARLRPRGAPPWHATRCNDDSPPSTTTDHAITR
ncbi:MAG: hypothetical protein AAFX79_08830 [Planctomycetota bacterium]